MAKRATLEERIAELSELGGGESTAAKQQTILKALASKIGLLVAAAAEAATSVEFRDDDAERLESALAAAFLTMSQEGVKRDPMCRAKLAIAETLHDRAALRDEVFALGVTLVQDEPVWGGKQDTAADLRARCGLAYAELDHPEAVNILARLLADPERSARAGAAHALGNSGRVEAVPLLRFKTLIGDEEPEVFSATLRALLTLESDESLAFIASFLERDDHIAEAAALCLGESRLEGALPLLRAWAEDPARREVGFLAIALLRSEAATDFLIASIETGDEETAEAAERALDAFLHDSALSARVKRARAKQRR